MTYRAHGSFTINTQPITPAPAEGLSRFSIEKQIHGDLEATSKGEMLAGGDYKQGAAGYVAIEMVMGVLQKKHGSFALQQMATMDSKGSKISVVIVPGSGTGELKGIAGTFTIQIADGKHSYELEYTLPE
jgi:di/tripeptidase